MMAQRVKPRADLRQGTARFSFAPRPRYEEYSSRIDIASAFCRADAVTSREVHVTESYEGTLYAALGGHSTLSRVHRRFYDALYAHPWLQHFFADIDQDHIEKQQTDFMAQSMGGPAQFCGQLPAYAHQHMYITEELFELRHQLLDEAIRACGVGDDLRERWLKIDAAFKRRLVKSSVDQCVPRYKYEPVLVVDKPASPAGEVASAAPQSSTRSQTMG